MRTGNTIIRHVSAASRGAGAARSAASLRPAHAFAAPQQQQGRCLTTTTALLDQAAAGGAAPPSPPGASDAPSPPPKKKGGIIQSILHGSEKAKHEGPLAAEAGGSGSQTGQHSHIVGRGKYVHEVIKHKVKPGKSQEYKQVIKEYYTDLLKNADIDIKLTGSWEVVVGDLDTFYHIWEHNGFSSFDSVVPKVQQTAEYKTFQSKVLPLLDNRTTQLVQEFSFWPSSPPKQLGGIYEMRIYTLKPGTLLEWENEWKVGLEARRKFVEPIGAWFSQVGELHQVIHMWHYDSLESRKQKRQRAWEIDTWSNTVAKTVKLANHMSAQILHPLDFSPLR